MRREIGENWLFYCEHVSLSRWIKEYFKLEGTQKDHGVQLVHEWLQGDRTHDLGIIGTVLWLAVLCEEQNNLSVRINQSD